MARVTYRVTFESEDDLPRVSEVQFVLRDEFDFENDGRVSVVVDEMPHLRGIDGGSAASRRENRSQGELG